MTETYQYYEPQYNDSDTRSHYNGQRPNNKKGGSKLLKTIALALVFGLIAGLTFTGVSYAGSKLLGNNTQVQTESQTNTVTEKKEGQTTEALLNTATSSNANIADIVDETMPAVVSITCMSVQEVQSFFGTQMQEAKSAGSGIIIDENDDELFIATNNHVVAGSEKLTVTFADEKSVEGTIKGTDSKLDLAVVSVKKADISDETKQKIKIATMGDSSSVRVGEMAIAIGNALGYGQSVTTGIISATERSIEGVTGKYIQTDAAINPGNSGGALLNAKGEIIGINSAKIQDTSVEGMGYAIPISDAKEILQSLMNRQTREQVAEEDRGFLGITGRTVDEASAQLYDLPVGVYVSAVQEGSAADKAGIEEGMIITTFDDTNLDGMDSLQSLLKTYKAGEKVKVKVAVPNKRNEYQEKTIEVTLDRARN
ncbi:MAG: trypsin-like peptidase domain-containing protein [Lachnospiraceae bacterium]|nr:trypsin-like peptidase domain-containing protein [Lachnospiraceae bacterium]